MVCLLLACFFSAPKSVADVFPPNTRWLAVGDSITQNGAYQAGIYLFYATRFPGQTLEVLNAGVSGDSAKGALRRFEWDIAPRRATVATVMFGMNDVERHLYEEGAVTPKIRKQRRAALDLVAENMAELADRLSNGGARVVLVTPSIFDDTADGDRPRLPGVNSALGECASAMRRLAAERGYEVVDLHGPMSLMNQKLQEKDHGFSIIGSDRVHPGAAGHLLMTYLFLKAQNAPGLVSRIDVDAALATVSAAENCSVKDLTVTKGGLGFSALASALPFPIPPDATEALGWVPFQDDLNREVLRVTGLPPGKYGLSIDGIEVARYRSEEFAAGINLATEENTPQMQQAAAVAKLIQRWRELMRDARVIAQAEHWILRDTPRPVTFEAVRARLEEQAKRFAASADGMDRYNGNLIARYLEIKPTEEKNRAETNEVVRQIRESAQPKKQEYKITPVPAAAPRESGIP